MKPYIELTKPRITWLILMSTAIGFVFGAKSWHWLILLHTIIGTGLIASGTAALNQWVEREADGKMRRTQARPLPSGQLDATRALIFAIAISILGFAELAFGVNLLTGLLGLFTLLSYLFIYTPLKQRSPHSTTVGAIPGAMPPLIGYAAASGTLTWEAWALFAILFIWQFPHFYAIAWMYREDYARAGIKMLPVVESDGESTARRIVLYSLALLPISLMPKFLGMTGNIYLYGAAILGMLFLFTGYRILNDRTRQCARNVTITELRQQRLQAIGPKMQRMLERHPHGAEHLVSVVNDARGTLLSMQCRQCRIAFARRPRRFQSEPSHAACEHGALGHAMAQRLKRAERSAELLAQTEVFDGRCDRRLQQTAGFRGKRDAQPLADVRCGARRKAASSSTSPFSLPIG